MDFAKMGNPYRRVFNHLEPKKQSESVECAGPRR